MKCLVTIIVIASLLAVVFPKEHELDFSKLSTQNKQNLESGLDKIEWQCKKMFSNFKKNFTIDDLIKKSHDIYEEIFKIISNPIPSNQTQTTRSNSNVHHKDALNKLRIATSKNIKGEDLQNMLKDYKTFRNDLKHFNSKDKKSVKKLNKSGNVLYHDIEKIVPKMKSIETSVAKKNRALSKDELDFLQKTTSQALAVPEKLLLLLLGGGKGGDKPKPGGGGDSDGEGGGDGDSGSEGGDEGSEE